MEETTPTFIQEYFGEYGIMGSIIVILLFIIGFLYLRQKYPKMTLTKAEFNLQMQQNSD